MKWIAIAFALLLVVLVLLADIGADSAVFKWYRAVPGRDTTAHFMLIGTLALLINTAFRTGWMRVAGLAVQRGTVVLAALVTLEECGQLFLVHRSFSWSDMAANWAGIIALGEVVPMIARRVLRSRRGLAAAP